MKKQTVTHDIFLVKHSRSLSIFSVCIIISWICFLLPATVYANTASSVAVFTEGGKNTTPVLNAGLVNGLWFSKTPFFAGETIRVYTAFQNQSGLDITGDIVFYNDGTVIAKKSFNSVNGQVIQSWADWKVTEGNHNVYIEIEQVKAAEIGGEIKSVAVQVKKFDKVPVFVDLDTDHDNVGNAIDTDDDGDGISDVKEIEKGTNPLLPNIEKSRDISTSVDNILDNLPIPNGDIKNIVASTTTNTLNIIDKTANSLKDYAIAYKNSIDKDLEKNSENKKSEEIQGNTKNTNSILGTSTDQAVKKKIPIEDYKANTENAEAWPLIYLKGALSLVLAFIIFVLSYTFSLYLAICLLIYMIWRIVKRVIGK